MYFFTDELSPVLPYGNEMKIDHRQKYRMLLTLKKSSSWGLRQSLLPLKEKPAKL